MENKYSDEQIDIFATSSLNEGTITKLAKEIKELREHSKASKNSYKVYKAPGFNGYVTKSVQNNETETINADFFTISEGHAHFRDKDWKTIAIFAKNYWIKVEKV